MELIYIDNRIIRNLAPEPVQAKINVYAAPEIALAEKNIVLSFLDFSCVMKTKTKMEVQREAIATDPRLGPFRDPTSIRILLTIILLRSLFWPVSRWFGV